ncbi:unnamed protein product [Schistocephalus solidus]|uniref:Secreted protein n=1 Tax=Schistocephalus solidus TaxID=70667 RepID=A0A183SAJ4_SCHSO|nr:unnamed protein product [Schistocephalus solidus]
MVFAAVNRLPGVDCTRNFDDRGGFLCFHHLVGGLSNQQCESHVRISGTSTMTFASSMVLFSFDAKRTDEAHNGFP